MHHIASLITDPSKLLGFPLIMFRTCAEFGLSMIQQANNFAQDIMKLMV